MTARIDHVVLASRDLEDAKKQWHADTGLAAIDGGSHTGRGTRNALSGLAGQTYVELLAVDPDQPSSQHPTLPATLSPFHWAVCVVDMSALSAWLTEKGLNHTGAINMTRKTTSGENLNWQLLFIRGHSDGGCMPFFIDWRDAEHPSQSLSDAARLEELCVSAPDDSSLHWLLPELSLPDVRLERAAHRLAFRFVIDGDKTTSRAHTSSVDDPAGFKLG